MDEQEKAQPKSVLERARRKAVPVTVRDTEEERHATGWYQYFKQDDVNMLECQQLVVHPTPLLSIVDHFARSAQGSARRVVGCLLGETSRNHTHITSSFGVPFEEHPKDPSVWYLDHSYLDKMYRMFKKINVRENVVGWYSSAGSIRRNDHLIHELFRKYCRHPVFLVVNVDAPPAAAAPGPEAPLVQAFYAFEQPSAEPENRRTFVHAAFELGASEAEEVGVEHLLRDVETNYEVSLGTAIANKVQAVETAAKKLEQVASYLKAVADGELPAQPHILAQVQVLLNSLPDKTDSKILLQGFQKCTNDALLATYIEKDEG